MLQLPLVKLDIDRLVLVDSLRWRHTGRDSVSNHQPHDCLLNRLFRRRSKKTSKRRVTGLCARNSPGTGEFPTQMASNVENVSIWWRHHVNMKLLCCWIISLLGITHLCVGRSGCKSRISINRPSLVQIVTCRLDGTKPFIVASVGILLNRHHMMLHHFLNFS